ncbi:iron ABC transporter permease [Thalassotalea sp. M1531]|uniref:Iron ABC transporter permease n=1 Tax=Thalassotalea algicola TaxID=2716224 RepID=A0A7Y0LCM6_9GAMM|nr:iron ABC transporter permease [Thalassotalea algicola]NMP31733.1 iron ABC transporter permease [Thalassotalea algicola]
MNKLSPVIALVSLILLSGLSILSALAFGAADINLLQTLGALRLSGSEPFVEQIIWQLRMPRTLLAFIAGGGLAVAGLMLQTVTRNPLADPYLFGISSGAAVGVVLFVAFSGAGIFHVAQLSLSVAAFIGSLVAMALLLAVSGTAVAKQVESMLLAGVALSFLFSAITSVTLYWSDPQAISAVLFWTMGSFSRAQWPHLVLPGILLVTVLLSILCLRRQFTALLLGDESAITLGVNVRRFRLLMLLLSSLLTASLVSVCGGIGFVGLMIPHVVRFFISQAQPLTPVLVCLLGGLFMVWVDVLSRLLLANQELPVGIITGLFGSLFFLGLMYMRQHRYQE